MGRQAYQGGLGNFRFEIRFYFFVFSFNQVTKLVEQRQYAAQIKEALDLIKFSENAIKSKAEEDDNARKTFAEKKLKPKGNRSFSDLL